MRTSTPEVVKKEGLAEVMGAGRLVHWERPLLFALAWFTSNLALMPILIYPYNEGVEWSVSAPSPWGVLAVLATSLVLAVLALVVLKRIGQVFLAVPVLALLYSLLSRLIYAARYRLELGDHFDEEGASIIGDWFNFQIFTSVTVWHLLFFLSLALGLKLMSSRWLGLFLGAMGGSILANLGGHAVSTMFGNSVTWDTAEIIWLGQGLVEGILFALLLILALAIVAPRNKEPRVRHGFYVGTVLGSFVLSMILSFTVIVMIAAELWDFEDQLLPVGLLLFFALALIVPGAIVFMVLVHKMWASIQDGHARTRPDSALGFLFIPVFNFYWIFQAFWGFAKDYNAFTLRHGLNDAPTLAPGLFLANSLLALGGVIPVVGVLLAPATFVVGMVMISRICDAVNAVPEKDALLPEKDALLGEEQMPSEQPTSVTGPNKRPTSVTVISWLLLILACIGVIVVVVLAVMVSANPGFGGLVAVLVFAVSLQLIVAIGMLRGHNWARLLFLWTAPMAFSIVLIWGTPSLNTFVQIVLYSISLWFLTRPKALEYFRGMGSQDLEEEVGVDDKAEGVDEANSDYRR